MQSQGVLSYLLRPVILRRVAAVAVGCAILGGLYATLAPKWYRSAVTVMPAKQQRSSISGLLGDFAGLAAGFDAAAGGGADGARISAVLQSQAVTDAVIRKFDLQTRYDEKYLETTREALWRHCDVKLLTKPNLVTLSCEDKDPAFVQQLLQFFSEHGNQVFRRVSTSSATEEVRFLERRVTELREKADETASRMQEFQEKFQIVDLETQSKAVVSAMAALNSQRINKQLELDYARTFSAADESTLQQLRSQIAVMDQQLKAMEDAERREITPAPAARSKKGLFPAALDVPRLRAEYEKLYRDRKVAEATLVFALERLEGARANEARDVSTFYVLDPPTQASRHSRPKRSLAVGLGGLVGLFGALAYEWIRAIGGVGAAVQLITRPPPRKAA